LTDVDDRSIISPMARTPSRQTIIEEGARIVHARGFRAAGLKEILDAAGVPKGSFYFHFKSKEDFGLALVDHFQSLIESAGEKLLGDQGTPPLERLARFMDAYENMFEKMGFSRGCPIGNLMQEMSDVSEAFRERVARAYEGMHAAIQAVLDEAKGLGQVAGHLDTEETAWFILDSWEGAIMHMKLAKSTRPLRICRRMVFERILAGADAHARKRGGKRHG